LIVAADLISAELFAKERLEKVYRPLKLPRVFHTFTKSREM